MFPDAGVKPASRPAPHSFSRLQPNPEPGGGWWKCPRGLRGHLAFKSPSGAFDALAFALFCSVMERVVWKVEGEEYRAAGAIYTIPQGCAAVRTRSLGEEFGLDHSRVRRYLRLFEAAGLLDVFRVLREGTRYCAFTMVRARLENGAGAAASPRPAADKAPHVPPPPAPHLNPNPQQVFLPLGAPSSAPSPAPQKKKAKENLEENPTPHPVEVEGGSNPAGSEGRTEAKPEPAPADKGGFEVKLPPAVQALADVWAAEGLGDTERTDQGYRYGAVHGAIFKAIKQVGHRRLLEDAIRAYAAKLRKVDKLKRYAKSFANFFLSGQWAELLPSPSPEASAPRDRGGVEAPPDPGAVPPAALPPVLLPAIQAGARFERDSEGEWVALFEGEWFGGETPEALARTLRDLFLEFEPDDALEAALAAWEEML